MEKILIVAMAFLCCHVGFGQEKAAVDSLDAPVDSLMISEIISEGYINISDSSVPERIAVIVNITYNPDGSIADDRVTLICRKFPKRIFCESDAKAAGKFVEYLYARETRRANAIVKRILARGDLSQQIGNSKCVFKCGCQIVILFNYFLSPPGARRPKKVEF